MGIPHQLIRNQVCKPTILFYELYYGNNNDQGEEDKTPMEEYPKHGGNNIKVIKKVPPMITSFDHNGTAIIFSMQELTIKMLVLIKIPTES